MHMLMLDKFWQTGCDTNLGNTIKQKRPWETEFRQRTGRFSRKASNALLYSRHVCGMTPDNPLFSGGEMVSYQDCAFSSIEPPVPVACPLKTLHSRHLVCHVFDLSVHPCSVTPPSSLEAPPSLLPCSLLRTPPLPHSLPRKVDTCDGCPSFVLEKSLDARTNQETRRLLAALNHLSRVFSSSLFVSSLSLPA